MFYILLLVVVFVILYPKFPLFPVPGTYVAIRVEDFLVSLVLFLWIISNIKNIPNLLRLKATKLLIIFWSVGALSLLSGIFLTYTVHPHLGFLHLLRRVEMMSLLLVAATTIKSRKHLKILLVTLIMSAFLVVIYGLGQVYLNFPVISTNNKEFSKGLILALTPGARPNSTFAGHYDLAIFLSMMLIFISNYFLFSKNILSKVVLAGLACISMYLLSLTAARTSLVATFVGLFFNFWFLGKKLLIIVLVFASLALVIAVPQLRHRLVATLTVNILNGGGPKYQPVENTIDNSYYLERQKLATSPGIVNTLRQKVFYEDEATESSKASNIPSDIAPGEPINYTELEVSRSLDIRLNVEWPKAILAFSRNPILGTGYSSITNATDNDYLRSLGETGILGTVTLGLLVWFILSKLLTYGKLTDLLERLFIISTLASFAILAATALLFDVLEASKVAVLLWTICGACLAIAANYKIFDKDKDL